MEDPRTKTPAQIVSDRIARHGLNPGDYDVAQIVDAVGVWDLYPVLKEKVWRIDVDNRTFLDLFVKAEILDGHRRSRP